MCVRGVCVSVHKQLTLITGKGPHIFPPAFSCPPPTPTALGEIVEGKPQA